MENNIILSICIPTFNRAEYLEKTILSIVLQKRFQDTTDVEIIISDNCSDDNTSGISEKYIQIYGNKIRYYRNQENIKDTNFEKVLSYGKGTFLKLNNDTLVHKIDSLDLMIDLVNKNKENKNLLFFSNGILKNVTSICCENLNTFVKTVSYNSTWIGSFGIWKDDFLSIDNFSRNTKLQLVQTDILFELISSNKFVLVDNSKIFISIPPASKGGYNIYQVFITNYFSLLETYVKKKQISWFTLFNEKSKLMIYFIIPWTFHLCTNESKDTFSYKNALPILFKKYRFHPIMYVGFVFFSCKIILYYILKFIKNI